MTDQASILNPTIFLGTFEWREPVTSLTDFLIALVCIYGLALLRKNSPEGWVGLKFYRLYFLMFAIGMTFAAWTGHALQAYLSFEWKMIGWLCSLSGQSFLAMASLCDIEDLIARRYYNILKGSIVMIFVFFLIWILSPYRGFEVAQMANGTIIGAVVFPLQLYRYIKLRATGNLIILVAILFGLLPGIVYNQQISVNQWFNYHDISHVLVSMFMGIMIFGVRKLEMQLVNKKV